MNAPQTTSVETSILVRTPIDKAFAVFTEDIGTPSHGRPNSQARVTLRDASGDRQDLV